MSSLTETKMCLKSKHSEEILVKAIQNLRKDSLFCDVTLVCDGHHMKAHRPILAASSSAFSEMFLAHPCSHPLIVLEGFSFKDMSSLVDFMYTGEVNLSETDIDSFLEVAGDLQVKGLTQAHTASTTDQQNYKECPSGQGEAGDVDFEGKKEMTSDALEVRSNTDVNYRPLDTMETLVEENTTQDDQKEIDVADNDSEAIVRIKQEKVMLMMDQHAQNQQKLYKGKASQVKYQYNQDFVASTGLGREFFKNYIVKEENLEGQMKLKCRICEKMMSGGYSDVVNHVESAHFPGSFVYDCSVCGDSFRSKQSLYNHKNTHHRTRKSK